MTEQKDLFGWPWFGNKERKYTESEVKELLVEVKKFNCGAIDIYLTRHANRVFEEWKKKHNKP